MENILENHIPERITLELETPYYRGSVQNLYEVAGHNELLISETTSGGSVFDVGTIFNIEGSDIGRASFRHLVYQELKNPNAWEALSRELPEVRAFIEKDMSGEAKKTLSSFCRDGANTHHIGMIERDSGKIYERGFPDEPSNLTLIRKYKVEKPRLRRVLGWHFYDYEKYHRIDGNVIPLEYIVRLGITSGSSILRKYTALGDAGKKEYLRELGVERPLVPWIQFDLPLVDLTTKYEPEDRNISRQEGALISGVNGHTFARSMMMAILGALLVKQIFSRMGLFLWDLKWEIARDGEDLVFVDTIDTDSVRVTVNIKRDGKLYFIHFNKQAMRDYYRIMHADWYQAINDAKKAAAAAGRPFTEVLSEGQKKKEYPATPAVDRDFLTIQKEKFYMIQKCIQDQTRDVREESEKIALMELDYYLRSGNKERYEEINSV